MITSSAFQPRPCAGAFDVIFMNTHEDLVIAWQNEISEQLKPPILGERAEPTAIRTGVASVSTYLGSFQSFLKSSPSSCLVSPANSFGLMDGGLDGHISAYYGGVSSLVPLVQATLAEEWCGEQNVGTCVIVDVRDLAEKAKQKDDPKHMPRYIAHVATMRVPKALRPDDDIPYRCMWALLTSLRKHNSAVAVAKQGENGGPGVCQKSSKHERIESVLCPGFGAGVGQFPKRECARLMVLAVKHFNEKMHSYAHQVRNPPGASQFWTVWDEAAKIEAAVCGFTCACTPTP